MNWSRAAGLTRFESTEKREQKKREKQIRQKLKDDLPHYADRCLKIRTKTKSLQKLTFNDSQLYIHNILERQLKETGKVRALILKGRQLGSSTYVEARFYHKVTHAKGLRAFILTHEDEATKNLFEMADRFHQNCPPLVKPSTGHSNAKELHFNKLDSGYRVGTAGTKGTGRSATIQYFHGSEVAYWPNAEDHLSGVMQAVPSEPGTEIILESTSAGAQGEFYRLCSEAAKGEGEYILIFVPWYWDQAYRAKVPKTFKRSSEEEALRIKYELADDQLMWRRLKIRELGSVHKFRREYPCDYAEAFAVEMPGALWKRENLDRTRVTHTPPLVRKVVAVDPPSKVAECGIVVAGMSLAKEVYLIDDRSKADVPEVWGALVINTFIDHKCDAIVYEANQGGDMVASVIKTAWEKRFGNRRAPLKEVWASKGKQARAEPISLLWTEPGDFSGHILNHLIALEDELCTWVPNTGQESPNRLDAAVWAATDLLESGPVGVPTPSAISLPTGGWGVGEKV